jgi:hypothetical protein
MRILIGGLCLLLMTACQSGGSTDSGGGNNGQTAGKRLTFKTKKDREFLNFLRSEGTRDQVARTVMYKLLKYGFSGNYSGISERDAEESLNEIFIKCEGDYCAMGDL